jgi:signal transduction histidine kinase
MQGFSTLLVEEAGAALSETGRDFATRINKSALVMDALLLDLLAFSAIAQQRLELFPLKLENAIQLALSRLGNEIQQQKASIEAIGPWPNVIGHDAALGQVLVNLLMNALKFVSPNERPRVRLRAQEQGEFIRIWVEDNGIGIAPEHQEQIFRLFTRLNGDRYEGTGVGLAIVQKAVERMCGRLGVESAPGQGSRFWFELWKADQRSLTTTLDPTIEQPA